MSYPIQSKSGLGGAAIYKKSGKLRDEKGKASIEGVINSLVSDLAKYLTDSSQSATDEW